MWPFNKRSAPPTLRGQGFFDLQCKYGHTEIAAGQGVVAIVMDAKATFGTPVSVKVDEQGRQQAAIKVASEDGGFIVMAATPSNLGEPLTPGDLVIWVPKTYMESVAQAFGDKRAGWVGFIRAKVAAEVTTPDNEFRIICRYD